MRIRTGVAIWVVVLALLVGQTTMAQTTALPWSFSMGTNYIDLVAPQFGFSHQLKDANWEGPSAGFPIHIELGRQITPSLNFTASYGMVKLEDAAKYQPGGALGVYNLNISNPYYWGLFGQMEYSLANGYILKEDALVDPYVTVGVGNSRISQDDFLTTIMGVGMDVRSGNIGFNTELDYAYLSERDDYIRFKMGIKVFIGKKNKSADPPLVVDTTKKIKKIAKETDKELEEENKAENKGINITINIGSMGDGGQPYVQTSQPQENSQQPSQPTEQTQQPADPVKEPYTQESQENPPSQTDDDLFDHVEDDKTNNNQKPKEPSTPKIEQSATIIPFAPGKRIHFDTNEYKIKANSHEYLNSIAKVLKQNPKYKVRIEGHTDDTFTREYNFELSENRAFAVMKYLLEQGVPAKQIMPPKGYGEDQPLEFNDSEEHRAMNRRTELTLIKA